MRKTALSLLLLTASAVASEQLLFDALKETSTLATRTKLNIDDMPSTITVIQNEELIRSSALTLHDALGMVTGIDATRSFNGWNTITMRGVATPKSFGFDKIKLTIDGVDVTSHLYETIYYYLDMSVDLIERIEILRGPASSVYGTGAFAGTINVVTKIGDGKEGSVGSIRVGDMGYRSTSALGVWRVGEWKLGVDLYKQGDKATVEYPDPINVSTGGFGGTSHQGFDDEMAGFVARKEGLTIQARIKNVAYKNHVGNMVYPAIDDGRQNKNQYIFAEIKHESVPYKELDLSVRAGVREYEFDNKTTLLDAQQMRDRLKANADFAAIASGYGITPAQLALIIDGNTTEYKNVDFYSLERSIYGEMVANFDYDRIKPTIGLYIENSENIKNHLTTNYTPDQVLASITDPSVRWGDEVRFSGKNSYKRTITALWLQNILSITDKLDLTVGARGDYCSDTKETLPSYRVGGVYRASDTSRVKLMAGHAFRSPSLIELYSAGGGLIPEGNDKLDAEKIDTVELSYLKRVVGGSLGATLFYSVQKDAIDANSSREKFFNYPDRTTKGVEFEYKQQVASHHQIGFNYTHLHTSTEGLQPFSEELNPKMADIATNMGNIFHTWYLPRGLQLNSNINYIGSRLQSKNRDEPSQSRTDSYVVFNESLLWDINRDTDLKLIVTNLFDTETTTASLYGLHRDGTPQVGRRVYFGVSHRF